MAVFSVLDYERKIQISDKTRLSATKCFAPAGSVAITTLTIKPEESTGAINIFNANESLRYLDWAYSSFTWDVDSSLNQITFEEGSTEYTATLTSATYSLATLATHIAAQMTTAGTHTYAASVANQKITISATGNFNFVAGDLVAALGFSKNTTGSTAQTGAVVQAMRKRVTLAAGNGVDTDIKYFYPMIYNEDGDYLFSDDGLIQQHEPDIWKWVPPGRASFLDVHRRSQELIMAWIDEKGYISTLGEKFSKFDIKDLEEVRQWSGMMTLRLIFEGISNAVDDVFDRKAKKYSLLEEAARQRAVLRIDTDGTGDIEDNVEGLSISSGSLFRR